jgi:hypothetical protein
LAISFPQPGATTGTLIDAIVLREPPHTQFDYIIQLSAAIIPVSGLHDKHLKANSNTDRTGGESAILAANTPAKPPII